MISAELIKQNRKFCFCFFFFKPKYLFVSKILRSKESFPGLFQLWPEKLDLGRNSLEQSGSWAASHRPGHREKGPTLQLLTSHFRALTRNRKGGSKSNFSSHRQLFHITDSLTARSPWCDQGWEFPFFFIPAIKDHLSIYIHQGRTTIPLPFFN